MTRIMRPLLSGMVITIAFLHGTTARPLPSTSSTLNDSTSLEANNSIAQLHPAASNDSASEPSTLVFDSDLHAHNGTSPLERRVPTIPTVPLLPGVTAGSNADHDWAYNTYTQLKRRSRPTQGNSHAHAMNDLFEEILQRDPSIARPADTANRWVRLGKWRINAQLDEPALDNRMLSALDDRLWTKMQIWGRNDVEDWYAIQNGVNPGSGRAKTMTTEATIRVRLRMEGRTTRSIGVVLGHIPAERYSAQGTAQQAQAHAGPSQVEDIPDSPSYEDAKEASDIYNARCRMEDVAAHLKSEYPGHADDYYHDAAVRYVNRGMMLGDRSRPVSGPSQPSRGSQPAPASRPPALSAEDQETVERYQYWRSHGMNDERARANAATQLLAYNRARGGTIEQARAAVDRTLRQAGI